MAQKQLNPHMWNLETIFKSIYNVPVYQRPYSWDIEQVQVLLKDIYEAYSSIEKDDGYYTGNLIIFDIAEKINGIIPVYDIIDGQQRITTFSLILLAIYCTALEDGWDINDRTIGTVRDSLWKIINRENKREFPAVFLNSIEKKCFSDLFNKAFDTPIGIISYCNVYKCESKFDERVIKNFKYIYKYLKENICKSEKPTAILDYADYLLRYVNFIAIEANCNEKKVFSMFESINSKGKKLEDIDLIKSYIFSKLDECSYETYLNIWGQLIIRTKDNLYDYLSNYIKAFLCFYRQNISVDNFKTIVHRDMLQYYNVNNEKDALKFFLDDMYNKVDMYNMLRSAEAANKIVKNSKFRFYYKIFTEVAYKHPYPLFLRMLIEFQENKLQKDDVVEIVKETVGFMFKFLTISGKDSKDVITMFSSIMKDIYDNNRIIKDNIINSLATEYINKSITTERLKSDLSSIDSYGQNKKLTVALLSLYESCNKNSDGDINISFDQAYMLLNSFSDSFSLDHLLVQNPDKESSCFMYYREYNDTLSLKQGHDFPADIVIAGMEYDLFVRKVLNRIGNLRIYYKDKNSGRQNSAISLKNYVNFYNYSDIIKRSKDIENVIFDKCFPQPSTNLITMQKATKLKTTNSTFPKMDKLIECGVLSPGDTLYITCYPENSDAILIDAKYVNYKGTKLTLNEWGCKVTGWKSIRIYSYCAKKGEVETLQEKREALILKSL